MSFWTTLFVFNSNHEEELALDTGDERANENSVLASIHTMFVRFHNQVVKGLHRRNPHWEKERLVQV